MRKPPHSPESNLEICSDRRSPLILCNKEYLNRQERIPVGTLENPKPTFRQGLGPFSRTFHQSLLFY